MYDENHNTPIPPAPEQEPNEVVSWYVRPDEGREVRDCYVQPRPMPAPAVPAAAPEKKPHSRRGLWIFLVIMAVLVGAVLGVAIVSAIRGGDSPYDGGYDFGDGDHDASSIVDIFGSDVPTIPRADIEPDRRFFCEKADGDKLTIQQVYQQVAPSTVLVLTDLGEKASIGTGVILSEDGYVVTNAHVIAGGKSVLVATYSGEQMEAELVGFSSTEDLALLKIPDVSGLPAATLGDSDACVVGDTVYAIGNPLGVELLGTLTEGIISAIDRQVTMEGRVMTLLQTTAALNNGNSGGPLINEYAQVVGINTLKMSNTVSDTSATVEGLGFAVPTGRVVSVINDIAATGSFHGMPSIGVSVMETEQSDGTTRPVIDSVTENFGAAAAGLQKGDVILAADGVQVYHNNDLLAVRRTHIVGETVVLTVQREGRTFDAEVYLYPVEG